MEEEEPTGFVCFEKFQPMMAKVLLERRYQPVSEEMLLKAFQVLDVDKNSHITPEENGKQVEPQPSEAEAWVPSAHAQESEEDEVG